MKMTEADRTESCRSRGYFLSDLHLFSQRSQAESWMTEIHAAVGRAHTFVLGGDIFDFRWSRHRSLGHSINEAMEWLEHLVSLNDRCSFYYVLGNHDAHPTFVEELDGLCFRQPRLEWQPYSLRLGSCVFLHGDIVDGGQDHRDIELRRRRHEEKPAPAAYRHWLYDVIVKARVHRLVANLANPHDWVLEKLSRYLAEQGHDATHGVTDVYFGHTHREVHGLRYRDQTFHNGGAPIKGLSFRIVETRLEVPAP